MVRTFTAEDQLSFASLSGDFNPMHVDAIAARRLMFGRPVVHGIHATLWAIDQYLSQRAEGSVQPVRINRLSVEFSSPMLVDDPVDLSVVSRGSGAIHLELTSGGNKSATIELSLDSGNGIANGVSPSISLPAKLPCKEIAPADAKSAVGELPLHLNPELASALFPALSHLLDPSQFAALLATTRLVGMELPGLHSVYTGFEVTWSDESKKPVLAYAVEENNQRLAMLLNIAITAPGIKGKLSAAFRPPPTRQAEFREFQRLIKPDEFHGVRALVIGGSRGLGEVAVKELVAGGAEVRFTYRTGAADAQQIVDDIQSAGGLVSCFSLSVETDADKLPQKLGDWRPTLLCYFATPHISSSVPGQFQSDRFYRFCEVYVDAFIKIFNALSAGLHGVLYPSSSFVDELPPNMAEYALAKRTAENLCQYLMKSNPTIRFHTPRYSRLATDQTATMVPIAIGDPRQVILDSVRTVISGKTQDSQSVPAVNSQPVIAGPAFTITSTFTCEPIEPYLHFWMGEIGQPGPVEFASYNQVFQALLEPAGLMSRKNFANAVLIRFEDWIEGDKSALEAQTWRARLKPLIDDVVTAARAIARPAPTLVLVCPPSTKVAVNAGTAIVLDELAIELVTALKDVPGFFAFGPQAVSAIYPVADYYSAGGDTVAKIPYTPKYFAALGTFLVRSALAVRRLPFKVIVLDCDNTLWAGVCGEGGVAAVSVGAGFIAMQEFVLNQIAQGKVVCLCSKNTESDVWDIFDNHPDMLLKRNQIVAYRINWSPKGQNLRELATELNVGLDSFIFLDDNPVECAEVRSSCPEVLTLQAPARGEDWPLFLKHIWAFDQLKVTDQDQKRAASYIQNANREAVRKESTGLEDFLTKLELKVEITPLAPAKIARVAQLTERTNQFNFSTIRRSEAEIIALLKNSQYQCDTVEVQDRFGDYGLVGVMITRNEIGALTLDTMLLSCRVLGRGVEHRMLASIGQRAKSLRLAGVVVPFKRSEKNQPALDFLTGVAREYRSNSADGFSFHIPAAVAAATHAKMTPPALIEEDKSSDTRNEKTVTAPVPYQRIAEKFADVDAIVAAVSPTLVERGGSSQLKSIVAELLGIAPEQLAADRVLSGARLPGSLGRAILDAALRDRLGIESPACYTAKTFGELETAVNGTAVSVTTPVKTPPGFAATNGQPKLNELADQLARTIPSNTCGADIELVESLPIASDFRSHEFYTTNFTPAEIAYCVTQQSPRQHFAARWCAKEALKKCDSTWLSEPMRKLEVISQPDGAPSLRHHTNAGAVDLRYRISLSHTELAAMAVVVSSESEPVSPRPVSAQSLPAVAATPAKSWIKRIGWINRLKQNFIRRFADAIARDAEIRRRLAWEAMSILHPTAVIFPESVIDNLPEKRERITIGEHSYIRGRLLVYPNAGSITIGKWSYVGARTEIWAMADMKIGDRVMIANGVTILDCSGHSRNAAERHAHFRAIVTTGHPKDWADLPGMTAAQIVIEDDAWIGAGTSILPGVRIGARAVVAAGSKVSTDIPPDTIYWNETKAESIPNYV